MGPDTNLNPNRNEISVEYSVYICTSIENVIFYLVNCQKLSNYLNNLLYSKLLRLETWHARLGMIV